MRHEPPPDGRRHRRPQRLAHQHRTEVDRLTRERDAWAARCVWDNEERPCATVRAINDALGIRDDSRREGYEYP